MNDFDLELRGFIDERIEQAQRDAANNPEVVAAKQRLLDASKTAHQDNELPAHILAAVDQYFDAAADLSAAMLRAMYQQGARDTVALMRKLEIIK